MKRLTMAVMALLCGVGTGGEAVAQGQAVPSPIEPVKKLLDTPKNTILQKFVERGSGEKGDITGIITCVYYAAFTVKYIETGEGADAISVTPTHGAALPPCGRQDDPGETLLPGGSGMMFMGAKGSFLYLVYPEGYGFAVYSAVTRKRLYQDERAGDDAIRSLFVNGNSLTLRYLRLVTAPCSMIADGAACWARTLREAHLPAAISSQPAPVALCQAGYASYGQSVGRPVDPQQPSAIGYEATVEIDPSGKSTVLKRGPMEYCGILD